MDSKKIIAASVVALFCVTAYAIIAADSSDAASTENYEIYVEIIGTNGSVNDAAFVYFESEKDPAKFVDAANAAFKAAGLTNLKLFYDDWIGIEYEAGGNDINGSYFSDGSKWVTVSDTTSEYLSHSKLAMVVDNGYIDTATYAAVPVEEQANWNETGYGDPYAYIKIPAATAKTGAMTEYEVNLTMIDDDLIKTTTEVIKFTSENNAWAWCYGLKAAISNNSIFTKLEFSKISDEAIYLIFDGSNSNATYVKEKGEWVGVTKTAQQYTSGNEVDFELKNGYISTEKYNGLSSAEQKNWKESGMSGGYEYQRLPAASKSSSSDFPIIYVVVAIVAILLIACAAYYLMKNKKTA